MTLSRKHERGYPRAMLTYTGAAPRLRLLLMPRELKIIYIPRLFMYNDNIKQMCADIR